MLKGGFISPHAARHLTGRLHVANVESRLHRSIGGSAALCHISLLTGWVLSHIKRQNRDGDHRHASPTLSISVSCPHAEAWGFAWPRRSAAF